MATRDLASSLTAKQSIAPAAALTTSSTVIVGADSVDTLLYESVTVVFNVKRTAGSVLCYVQDSTDGTTWAGTTTPASTDCIPATAVIGGALPAAISADGTAVIGLTGVGGTAAASRSIGRYIRAVAIPTGLSGGVTATILLGHPRHRSAAV